MCTQGQGYSNIRAARDVHTSRNVQEVPSQGQLPSFLSHLKPWDFLHSPKARESHPFPGACPRKCSWRGHTQGLSPPSRAQQFPNSHMPAVTLKDLGDVSVGDSPDTPHTLL